jgi:hypothetical protein
VFGVIDSIQDDKIVVNPTCHNFALGEYLYDETDRLVGQVADVLACGTELKCLAVFDRNEFEMLKAIGVPLIPGDALFHFPEADGDLRRRESGSAEGKQVNVKHLKRLLKEYQAGEQRIDALVDKMRDMKIDNVSDAGTDKLLPNLDQISARSPSLNSLILNQSDLEANLSHFKDKLRKLRHLKKKSRGLKGLHKKFLDEDCDLNHGSDHDRDSIHNELELGKRAPNDLAERRGKSKPARQRPENSSGSSRISHLSDLSMVPPSLLSIPRFSFDISFGSDTLGYLLGDRAKEDSFSNELAEPDGCWNLPKKAIKHSDMMEEEVTFSQSIRQPVRGTRAHHNT